MQARFRRTGDPSRRSPRRLPVLFLLSLLCLCLTLGGTAQAQTTPRALWVWDASIIGDTTKRHNLISMCLTRGIGTIFIYTGSAFVEAPLNASKVQVPWSTLATFCTFVHNNGIKVYALDGDPALALTANHAKALGRLQSALSYNASYTQASLSRLDGFQWDTEPYLLTQWTTGGASGQEDITRQLLTSMTQMVSAVNGASPTFRLGYCAPFWFDDAARSMTFNGQTKVPAFHMLDILNGVSLGSHLAIMAYRDTPTGSNSTVSVSTGEVTYAQTSASNVKVWIGQETLNVSPASITWYQETNAQFEAAVPQITSAYSGNSVYAGIAIHDYPGYTALLTR